MDDAGGRYREHVERLVQAVRHAAGDTDASLRLAVAARAAVLGGGAAERADEPLPPPVAAYVERVALRAHEITDAEIQALLAAGYSQDAVFEITVGAALGAALGRLDRGLGALRGTPYAT